MARSKARYWTCKRVRKNGSRKGEPCATKNSVRRKYCAECGNERAPSAVRPPASHLKALKNFTYEDYIVFNGGNHCGICGRGPDETPLYREHEHKGDGFPRGIACFPCNALLRAGVTADRLRRAADYLDRAERRRGFDLVVDDDGVLSTPRKGKAG